MESSALRGNKKRVVLDNYVEISPVFVLHVSCTVRTRGLCSS